MNGLRAIAFGAPSWVLVDAWADLFTTLFHARARVCPANGTTRDRHLGSGALLGKLTDEAGRCRSQEPSKCVEAGGANDARKIGERDAVGIDQHEMPDTQMCEVFRDQCAAEADDADLCTAKDALTGVAKKPCLHVIGGIACNGTTFLREPE